MEYSGSNPQAPLTATSRTLDQATLHESDRLLVKRMGHGLVCSVDPAENPSSCATVTALPSLGQIQITPGAAYDSLGRNVTWGVRQLALPSVANGDLFAICAEYTVLESDLKTLSSSGSLTPSYGVESAVISAIRVRSFPIDWLTSQVILALVSVTLVDGILSVSVDMSRSRDARIRPWFSPVDREHRASVGTGLVTKANPHGLGLSDLAASSQLTLLGAMLRHGMIVAKDSSVDRVPGVRCLEKIAGVYTDLDASVTGIDNARYIRLSDFPIRLGSALDANDEDVPAYHIKGSNIVVLPCGGTPISIAYTSACGALEFLEHKDVLNVVEIEPSTEMVVTGGMVLSKFADSFVDFRGYRAFPMVIRVFAKPDGTFLLSPTLETCATLLEEQTDFSVELDVDSRIVIGLTGANVGGEIQVQVAGQGVELSTSDETLTITQDLDLIGSQTAALLCNNLASTSNVFKAGTTVTVKVISRTNDGPFAAIAVFSLPYQESKGVRDLCALADVNWNGLTVSQVRDVRTVGSTLSIPSKPINLHGRGVFGNRHDGIDFASPGATILEDSVRVVEDLNDRRYGTLRQQETKADRWSDGIGWPATDELYFDRPHYKTRAIMAPKLKTNDYLANKVRVRLDCYDDSTMDRITAMNLLSVGPLGFIKLRYVTTASDDWSPWYTFTPTQVSGRQFDYVEACTASSTDKIRAVQVETEIAMLRALAVEFAKTGAVEGREFVGNFSITNRSIFWANHVTTLHQAVIATSEGFEILSANLYELVPAGPQSDLVAAVISFKYNGVALESYQYDVEVETIDQVVYPYVSSASILKNSYSLSANTLLTGGPGKFAIVFNNCPSGSAVAPMNFQLKINAHISTGD